MKKEEIKMDDTDKELKAEYGIRGPVRESALIREAQKQARDLKDERPKTNVERAKYFPNYISPKTDDVKRIGSQVLYWYMQDKVDTDEELAERLEEYFTISMKYGSLPVIEEMALALGTTVIELNEWEKGKNGASEIRQKLVKKARVLLSSFEGKMVSEGKIHPTAYIFRAKNYFGLKDEVKHQIEPVNPLGGVSGEEELVKRIEASVAKDDE